MGLEITYIAGDTEFDLRITPLDMEIADALGKVGFAEDMENIFGVSDFDTRTKISRTVLLESVNRILLAIRKNPKLLPYIYSLERNVKTKVGIVPSVSVSSSGIRIAGEIYSFEGGLERCELFRHRQDQVGNRETDRPKDIRDVKTLTTDNLGEVKIKKNRKPICLVRNLKALKKFLQNTDVEEIEKLLG